MADNSEKSDDLIAELAKLMASGASGAEGGRKPGVIKLPPLNEATVQTQPVRIPGMEPPRQAEPARPASFGGLPGGVAPVRIPGMERPAGVDSPPQPKPAAQFDFGRPPPAAPTIQPEPMANWETREVPKVALSQPTPRPAAVQQLAAMRFDPVTTVSAEGKSAPAVTRIEPKPQQQPTIPMPPAPTPMSATPASAPSGDGFNFDFGFGGGQGGASSRQPPAAANDPIAELITAEMDAADKVPEGPSDDADGEDEAEEIRTAPAPAQARAMPSVPPPRPTPISIKPVSITPRGPEADRFTVAPVFANKPQPPAPPAPIANRANLDPMDEIESLIGEAVRVEMTPADRPNGTAPVVPPLNTNFAPRRAGLKDTEPQVQSAEAAILAAAAATGDAEPPRDDRKYKRMKVKPPKTAGVPSGARQYVGIAVAGTLLLAAGFGLYWVLGMNRDNPADAPVLTADSTPAKVQPTTPVADATEAPQSVVFDEINGDAADSASAETLVSRDETAGADVTDVASIVEPAGAAADEEATSESGLANRKVRTVTVRPDGTIVSGEDAVAGSEELPVDRPNVPEIEGANTEPSELLTAAVDETAATAAAGTTAPADTADQLSALAPTAGAEATPAAADVASAEPVVTTPAVFDGSLVAPLPMPRPGNRDQMVGGSARVASTSAATSAEPAPLEIGANAPASTPLTDVASTSSSSASNSGGAYVQLSSQKSEADANAAMKATQRSMASTLNGANLEIRRVNLGAKGVWYRVVLPTNSFQEATQTCANIKSAGGDCVAING